MGKRAESWIVKQLAYTYIYIYMLLFIRNIVSIFHNATNNIINMYRDDGKPD